MLADRRDLLSDEELRSGTPRIMVVDDHEGLRRLLSMVLQRAGYQIITCDDGPEALALLRTCTIDLMLLDLQLPQMDGYEVLAAVRANPNTADLPVIFLTANGETDQIVRGLQSGANDYVTKPFEEEVLLARVHTHLRLKELADQRKHDVERLEKLDALKDRFVVIASHDLKGPLGTVMSALDLMKNLVESDSLSADITRSLIEAMEASTQTMRSIIGDFLDLQAIKAGGIELNLRPISLNGLVEFTCEQFHYDAERKNICIELDLSPDVPAVMGDAERLMQIISNLVSNALKYSPSQTTIRVRSSCADGRARVEVEDQGPGISEDEIAHLFQEFVRLRNRPTGGETSSGVGLSITRDLVEMHSGKIGVESKVGTGSVFWFELPCEQAEIAQH
jgi:two-component system, sensor histidine kinase and response regulator